MSWRQRVGCTACRQDSETQQILRRGQNRLPVVATVEQPLRRLSDPGMKIDYPHIRFVLLFQKRRSVEGQPRHCSQIAEQLPLPQTALGLYIHAERHSLPHILHVLAGLAAADKPKDRLMHPQTPLPNSLLGESLPRREVVLEHPEPPMHGPLPYMRPRAASSPHHSSRRLAVERRIDGARR